jgi:UDP-N-acetylmuramate--alanine ligase
MSALARVLAQRGVPVSGSDMKESRYSRALRTLGVTIHIGHKTGQIGDADLVVYSTAIPQNNPEMVEARERGIEMWRRAQMLSYLAGSQKTIAIAGTHGKTSTSSMVTTMLRTMGEDPTFCVGGEIDGADTNAEHGSGDYYVVEADESDGSFLYLDPYIAVITNIEADHLDHYKGIDEIEMTFMAFMRSVSDKGCLIVCGDSQRLVELANSTGKRVVTYGTHSSCDIRCSVLGREGMGTRFEVFIEGERVSDEATISAPGEHMMLNACASLATAHCMGLDLSAAIAGLATFSGVRRRFDLVGEVQGVTVVDDYAHHPTEVAATINAAVSLSDFKRVIVLFQPHRYSRTQAFEREFGASFDKAYKVVLLDVYSASETPIPGVDGRTICDAILDHNQRAQVAYLPHRRDVIPYLASCIRAGDLVLTMGAGDVTAVGPELIKELEKRKETTPIANSRP